MRSWRAVALLRNSSVGSHVTGPKSIGLFRGYCSSCDAQPSTTGQASVKSKGKGATDSNVTTKLPKPPADHRELGIEQELFMNSVYSPGSPIFLPNGTRIFNNLTSFLRAQYTHFGFQEVITPTIYKKSLWEKSGHWQNYAEDMYAVSGRTTSRQETGEQGEEEEYGLKPMNCPGHCLIFASRPRSYRDLPIRYADFSPLHRNEISGALSGLTRVRRFHQDDGHIFCRPIQIKKEISESLEFIRLAYAALGLGPYRLTLSTRPKDHYIGTIEEWDNAEAALRESLDASGQPWTMNEGDGAFYGPKIDIIIRDSDGKEHQTATIQLDFQLPKRFELEYQAPAPELEQRGQTTTDPDLLATTGFVRPVMIHRAILGSVERLMALLIEHYNGRWPLWLNPRQVAIITVNDAAEVVAQAEAVQRLFQPAALQPRERAERADVDAADAVDVDAAPNWATPLHQESFTVTIDASPRSVSKKIAEAKQKRHGVIVVIGNKNLGDVHAEDTLLDVDLAGIPDQERVWREVARVTQQGKEGKKIKMSPGQLRSVVGRLVRDFS